MALATTAAPGSPGVYWQGADGNYYIKGVDTGGVHNIGSSLPQATSSTFTQIGDPNAPVSSGSTGGSTSGSSGSSATSTAAATAKAETAYHNNLNADMSTINSGISSGAGDYNQSILDAFNGSGGFKSQQANIDNEQVQNELSRLSGMQGIREMVNNGIQGGGVILDNAGAGTSSAGDALARAYGIQGRQQASKVGSQAAQGEHTIETEESNLQNAEDNFAGDTATKKQDIIYGIVSQAQQSLTYLNAIAASANLPDQINIAQQIAQIKANATAALTAFDGQLASSRAGNAPQSSDQYSSKAAQLFSAGTAPAKEFNFTSEAPATLQDTGPAASSLPIFASSAANKNDNGIVQ